MNTSRDISALKIMAPCLTNATQNSQRSSTRSVWVAALVYPTPGATASRFAGRSANRTLPIAMVTNTSVGFLGTP